MRRWRRRHRRRRPLAAEQSEARLQISAAVAETYANLGQLFADQRAARDAVRVRRESAELVESRSRSNLENEGAVSLARGQLHAAELESDALDRLIALIRDQLAALLGKGPDRGLASCLRRSRRPAASDCPLSFRSI